MALGRLRLLLALWLARAAAVLSRSLGRGGATALPGLLAERVAPGFVPTIASQFESGAVLITGTNGKTTTARLLASALSAGGHAFVHNREGSNLTRGIASALVHASDWRGYLKDSRTFALMETDEVTLTFAAGALQPRAVAFTNLFRDQLDRYGEVDAVSSHWRKALDSLPSDTTLVLNADDPSVAELALDWSGPLHWYSLAGAREEAAFPGPADARWCRDCGGVYDYELRYTGHLGRWRCSVCGRSSPQPDTRATSIEATPDGLRLVVSGLGDVEVPLGGIYNAANALAAISLARVIGISNGDIQAGLAATRPAFGRGELVVLGGLSLRLLLCKNPAGASEALRLVADEDGTVDVAFVLNDRLADGRDVSWIWDVDFELLSGRINRCWAGGVRAADAALRLHYAGWPISVSSRSTPGSFLDELTQWEGDNPVTILLTYTALLELRAELSRRGAYSQSTGGRISTATA